MKFSLSKILVAAALCLGTSNVALASPVTARFAMTGFESDAPVDAVSGSVTWDADSLFGPINHLTAINLNILGHAYSLNDVHVVTQTSAPGDFPWNTVIIAGLLNDIDGGSAIGTQTEDFYIRWHRDSHEWIDFAFATSSLPGIWGSDEWDDPKVSTFDIAPGQVPEPAAWSLLVMGLLMAAAQRAMRRRS